MDYSANLKTEALALWTKLIGLFAFIPMPELRGAAVVMCAVAILFLAPALFFVLLLALAGFVAFRASKDKP